MEDDTPRTNTRTENTKTPDIIDVNPVTSTGTVIELNPNAYMYQFPLRALTLNAQQIAVVMCDIHTNARILASAGSGKTTTITAKIAHMVQTLRVQPESIMLTTFTHNAAETMQQKICSLIGTTDIAIGTFHSLAQRILSGHGASDADIDDVYHVDELPFKLLEFMNTPAGTAWRATIKHVFVDEYQDVNEIQYKIVRSLRDAGAFVTIVGDDAQNIYTWRGSSVDYILRFEEAFSPLCDFQLSVNYRSTQAVVDCANDIMCNIPTLSHKERMRVPDAQRTEDKHGDPPQVHYFSRFREEKEWVCSRVQKLISGHHRPEEIAILCKYNTILFQVEEALLKAGIPCALLSRRTGGTVPTSCMGKVILSTFHSSKGLEWDTVFMMGMHDSYFPQNKTSGGVLQERRLFYVGVTRARSNLHFTYSNDARKLSRLVREIRREHLVYHNISNFTLSAFSSSSVKFSVTDLVQGLDGADYVHLKSAGIIPALRFASHKYYQDGLRFDYPAWVVAHDAYAEFGAFVDYVLRRMIGERVVASGGLHDRRAQEAIYSVRVARDDWDTYHKYEWLFGELIDFAYGTTGTTDVLGVGVVIPTPQFEMVRQFIRARHPSLNMPHVDMVHVMQILLKLRTVLTKLRGSNARLSDFTFLPSNFCIPSDKRVGMIRSYRAFQDRSRPWREILSDIWHVSCCHSVWYGRNAILYKPITDSNVAECMWFFEVLEKVVSNWVSCGRFSGTFLCNPSVHNGSMCGDLDLLAGAGGTTIVDFKTSYTSPLRMENIMQQLCYTHLARQAGYPVKSIVLFNPLSGEWLEMSVDGWEGGPELQEYLLKAAAAPLGVNTPMNPASREAARGLSLGVNTPLETVSTETDISVISE